MTGPDVAAVVIGLLVVVLAGMAWRRLRDTTEGRVHGEGHPLLMDRSANLYGLESAPDRRLRGNGFLALTPTHLVFVRYGRKHRLRIAHQEVLVATTTDRHRGRLVGTPMLRVTYRDGLRDDTATWWVADAEAWVRALHEVQANG